MRFSGLRTKGQNYGEIESEDKCEGESEGESSFNWSDKVEYYLYKNCWTKSDLHNKRLFIVANFKCVNIKKKVYWAHFMPQYNAWLISTTPAQLPRISASKIYSRVKLAFSHSTLCPFWWSLCRRDVAISAQIPCGIHCTVTGLIFFLSGGCIFFSDSSF